MTPSLRYPFASDERPQPDLGAALDPLCGIVTALRSPEIPGGEKPRRNPPQRRRPRRHK